MELGGGSRCSSTNIHHAGGAGGRPHADLGSSAALVLSLISTVLALIFATHHHGKFRFAEARDRIAI
jgi:phosphomevalonate kinase